MSATPPPLGAVVSVPQSVMDATEATTGVKRLPGRRQCPAADAAAIRYGYDCYGYEKAQLTRVAALAAEEALLAAEKAQAMLAALGPEILAKAAGKPIGLYFSAHWCPPCRGFTPQLAKFYEEGLKDKMEIVFCSSDKDQAQFDEYAAEIPWLALPYEKRAEKEALSDACGVEGIPTFAVINPDGTIVTADGRSKVCADPTGASFPDGWLPQPFNSANDSTDGLNEEQCVLAMGDDEGLKQAVEAVAQEHFAAAGKDVEAMPMRFFHAPAGGISDQIRKLTGVDGNRLVLLDIPDNGSFYLSDADVGAADAAQVKDFVAKVKAGGVEKQSFKK